MRNLELEIKKLTKDNNELKDKLQAHLEKQLDLPTEEDFNELEDENIELRKQVTHYINLLELNK